MDTLNRCFIGIRLTPDIQQKLVEVAGVIRHRAGSDLVRWTPQSELQMVVMALGELSIPTVEMVKQTIRPIFTQHPSMALTLEGLGGSPSSMQPRYVWCGVTGDVQQLITLHNALEAKLLPILREYEAKPFVPNLGLGRLKQESEQNRTQLGRAIRMSQVGCVGELMVNQVELLRSAVTASGPSLLPIESFPLGSQ
jgi:2'-5' RNA ligase